jgi:hypothetical protein
VDNALHPFERAGLGKAPFRFVGMFESKFQAAPGEPVRAGSTCDYCPSAIMQCYRIRSVDGREFKVGCECVRKVGDAALVNQVDKAKRAHERSKRERRAESVKVELAAKLGDGSVRAALANKPHPVTLMAAAGKSLLDWAEWMVQRAGAAGREKVLKAVSEASNV